jgi:hypothetical protein
VALHFGVGAQSGAGLIRGLRVGIRDPRSEGPHPIGRVRGLEGRQRRMRDGLHQRLRDRPLELSGLFQHQRRQLEGDRRWRLREGRYAAFGDEGQGRHHGELGHLPGHHRGFGVLWDPHARGRRQGTFGWAWAVAGRRRSGAATPRSPSPCRSRLRRRGLAPEPHTPGRDHGLRLGPDNPGWSGRRRFRSVRPRTRRGTPGARQATTAGGDRGSCLPPRGPGRARCRRLGAGPGSGCRWGPDPFPSSSWLPGDVRCLCQPPASGPTSSDCNGLGC